MLENELGADGADFVAIVAAMDEEVASVRARLVERRELSVAHGRVTLGRLGGTNVALAVTGDGERNARRGLEALLARRAVRSVLVVGVAGGLSAELGVGSLLVAERVLDEASGTFRATDAALVELTARVCAARRGVVVSARRIADTADERRRLLALTRTRQLLAEGVEGTPPSAAVDLESAAFATVAAQAGIPWVVLRAISDTADESVPALLNRCRDEGGAVLRGRVALGLLTDPGALRRLLELRKRVELCARRLVDAVELTAKELAAAAVLAPSAMESGRDPKNDLSTRGNLNGARTLAGRRQER